MAQTSSDKFQPKIRTGSTTKAAEILDASPGYVRQLIADGRLTGYRVGRLIKVDLNEVEALLVPIQTA